MSLHLTALTGIPLIRSGDDLPKIIQSSLRRHPIEPADNDILILGQKIVSKAEGRTVDLRTVRPSVRAQEIANMAEKDARVVELVLSESLQILRVRPGTIIVQHRLGFVCANAGIDHSNVGGDGGGLENFVLLLPRDPDRSAANIRTALENDSGKRLGVMIIDSHGRAWRLGTVGTSIGLSGLPPLVDERGWKDLFGYTLRSTVVGVADELAAAASLVMGQAGEGTPIIHARGFPYPLGNGSVKDIIRPTAEDLFR